jgi:hypothetical protein
MTKIVLLYSIAEVNGNTIFTSAPKWWDNFLTFYAYENDSAIIYKERIINVLATYNAEQSDEHKYYGFKDNIYYKYVLFKTIEDYTEFLLRFG